MPTLELVGNGKRIGGRRKSKLAEVEMPQHPWQTIEEWEKFGDQRLRDRMAARALFSAMGRVGMALGILGFQTTSHGGDSDEIAPRIFGTEGVKEMLYQDLSDVEARRKEILARQVEVAIHGNDDSSVRAAQFLANVAGWKKTPDFTVDNRKLTLQMLVSGHGEERNGRALPEPQEETVGFLDHEPGEPERVIMDESVHE